MKSLLASKKRVMGGGAVGKVSKLISSLAFLAPNRTDTQATFAKGSPTNTYTCSTLRRVPDFEGVLREVQITCPAFPGLRRVENLYLNSDTLGTQGVTTVAGQYRVTFEGTGTITFTGTATTSLVGGGAGVRKSILLTTTAGTLTSTVSGSVLFAQCENVTGATNQNPSEYLATTSAPLTIWKDYANPYTVDGNGVVTDSGVRTPLILPAWYKGLLSEPAATNLCLWSDDFSNATWTSENTTVTGTVGWFTQKLQETGATLIHDIYKSTGLALTAQAYTYSVFLKAGERGYAKVTCGLGGAFTGVFFNLLTGVVMGADSGYTGEIVPVFGGYRCIIHFTGTVATHYPAALISLDGVTQVYAGTVGNGIYLFGAQLEAGTVATSYMSTTTGTTTRGATGSAYDSAGNLPASGIRHISIQWIPSAITGTQYLWSSGTATDHTAILHDGTNIILRKRVASVNTDAIKALTPVAGATYQIDGYVYADNTTAIGVNGTLGTPNANTTAIQTAATMELGSLNGASQATGNFGPFKILGV